MTQDFNYLRPSSKLLRGWP